MRNRRRRGMSLVEVMVTIAIILAVSSVLALGVMHVWQEARAQQTRVTIAQVGQDVLTWQLRKSRVPTTAEGLAVLGREPPLDGWDRPFEYRAPGHDGSKYEIVSLGRDGELGGADLDEDIVWSPGPQ